MGGSEGRTRGITGSIANLDWCYIGGRSENARTGLRLMGGAVACLALTHGAQERRVRASPKRETAKPP